MSKKKILEHYQGPLAYDYAGGGFGPWIGRNAGSLASIAGGAVLSMTGAGAAIGAPMMVSGAAGIASDIGNQNQQTDTPQDNSAIIAQKMAEYQNSLKALGGSMEETGTFAPLSLTPRLSNFRQILEAGGHLPEGKATLKDAKEFIKAYPDEMAMGEKVEYEHTGNQKLAQRIAADHIKDHLSMTGGDPGYYSRLKQAGISDELNKMALGGMFDFKNGGIYVSKDNKNVFSEFTKKHGISSKQAIGLLRDMDKQGFIDPKNPQMRPEQYAKGGSLSPEKARKILHDGTVHGKPITDKQRKYFGVIASGKAKKMKDGGAIEKLYQQLGTKIYAEGGPGKTSVVQFFPRPHTDQTYYYEAAKAGIMGSGADSISFDQWKNMKPVERLKYIDPTKGFDYTIGNTANAGGIKWWGQEELPMAKPNSGWSKQYMDAKKKTNYPDDYVNKYVVPGFGEGGAFDSMRETGSLVTNYEGGGTHEQNPRGGIPVGQKARVEEGEVRVDFKDGSYIFSNRF